MPVADTPSRCEEAIIQQDMYWGDFRDTCDRERGHTGPHWTTGRLRCEPVGLLIWPADEVKAWFAEQPDAPERERGD